MLVKRRILRDTVDPNGGGGNTGSTEPNVPPTTEPTVPPTTPTTEPTTEVPPVALTETILKLAGVEIALKDDKGNRFYVDAEGNETPETVAKFLKDNLVPYYQKIAEQTVAQQLNELDNAFIEFKQYGGTSQDWNTAVGNITYSRVKFTGDDDPLRKEVVRQILKERKNDDDTINAMIEVQSRDANIWKNYSDKLLNGAVAEQTQKSKQTVELAKARVLAEQQEVTSFFTTVAESIKTTGKVPGSALFIPEADRAAAAAYFTNPVKKDEVTGTYKTQAQVFMSELANNPNQWVQTAMLIGFLNEKLQTLVTSNSNNTPIHRFFNFKKTETTPPGGKDKNTPTPPDLITIPS